MKELTLKIRNFGPINQAKIDIGKINIIAGKNDTGKTTSSKLFYCLLASVSSDGKYLANKGIITRINPIILTIIDLISDQHSTQADELSQYVDSLTEMGMRSNISRRSVNKIFNKMMNIIENLEFEHKKVFLNLLKEIEGIFKIKEGKYNYINIIRTLFEIEFNGPSQLIENYYDGIVHFYGQNEECEFHNRIIFSKFKVNVKLKNFLECFRINEVSYIETPYILDFMPLNVDLPDKSSNYHQRLLIRKLRDFPNEEDIYDEIINKQIIKIQENIVQIINGTFFFDKVENDFKFKKEDKSFAISNTASGIKQFGVVLQLLENRKLTKNSYLIMDEPEVHLHPEWQIKLAEIIVLLAKELNITLYINSHSPQFIEAIEVYSEYYNIHDDTNFYLTEKESNGKYNINKIEKYEFKKIYRNLGDPYDIIDEINGINLANKWKGSDLN